MSWYHGFRPYVPVAKRRAKAAGFAVKLAKKEKRQLAPINLTGRVIAASFWGKAWCENLERYSDFENRLPRGRSYVRNGSVIDLSIQHGQVKAIVSGSEIYQVTIDIKTLPAAKWSRIKEDCARSIDSLIDLLQARFDKGIMERLTQSDGLFPEPKEIKMRCTCPDWAGMCKHVAATLYGVGARLDHAPELLFTLRHVDHLELISQAVDADNLNQALAGQTENALADSNLGEIFGIELDNGAAKASATKVAVTGDESSPAASVSRPRGAKKPAAPRGKASVRSDPAEAIGAPKSRLVKKPKTRRKTTASAG